MQKTSLKKYLNEKKRTDTLFQCNIDFQNMNFKLLGRVCTILSSIKTTTQASITLQDPIIAETFDTVLKKKICTMYDITISVDLTNATITGLTKVNALIRIHKFT